MLEQYKQAARVYRNEGKATRLDELLAKLKGKPIYDEIMKMLDEEDKDSLVYESDLEKPTDKASIP